MALILIIDQLILAILGFILAKKKPPHIPEIQFKFGNFWWKITKKTKDFQELCHGFFHNSILNNNNHQWNRQPKLTLTQPDIFNIVLSHQEFHHLYVDIFVAIVFKISSNFVFFPKLIIYKSSRKNDYRLLKQSSKTFNFFHD